MDKRVMFRGYEFILSGGALSTRDMMAKGEISFAHVFEDGTIKCMNRIIGSADELTVLEDGLNVPVGLGVLFTTWYRDAWELAWGDWEHILVRDVTPKEMLHG